MAGGGDEFVAKAVFVADVERDFLVCHAKRGLRCAAALEVAQGHVHGVVEELGERFERFVFAKGDKVVFGVDGQLFRLRLRGVVGEVDDGVEVVFAIGCKQRHAHGEAAAVVAGGLGEFLDDFAGGVLQEHGEGGFGQDDDLGAGGSDLAQIALVGGEELVWGEFKPLFYVALRECNGGGAACGLGERDGTQKAA